MKISRRLAHVLDEEYPATDVSVERLAEEMTWALDLWGSAEPETRHVFVLVARRLDEALLAEEVIDPGVADVAVDAALDETPFGYFSSLHSDLLEEPLDPTADVGRQVAAVRVELKERVRRLLERALAGGRMPGRGGLRSTDGTVWRSERQRATPITWERTRDD